jgi:hypothetical protein
MKALILTALLATTGCVAVPIGFGVFKGSQMLNEARGGKPSETLTEADYNACKTGDEAACNRCFGYSVFLGAFHCTMWHPIHNALPTISDTDRTEYGGANYYAMPKGRK